MQAILTVTGKDQVGIVAAVSSALAGEQINILDISQTLMSDNFVMMMLVNVPEEADFTTINQKLTALGQRLGMEINLRNAKLYDAMHRV